MQTEFRPRVTKSSNKKEVALWKRLLDIVRKGGGIEAFMLLYFNDGKLPDRQYHKEETSYLSDGAK